MKKPKPILLLAFITIILFPELISQKTYFATDNKFTSLIDTKYLKNGDLVLLEKTRVCDFGNVKILKADGSTQSILGTGKIKFYSFNELPDNNWALTLITDPSDDVPMAYNYHSVTFIDGVYEKFSLINGDEISIPLEDIYNSAVINSDELVLIGDKKVYFTDFELSTITDVSLNNNIRLIKAPLPGEGFLYYQYEGEDRIFSTENRFTSEQLIAFDLGNSFRNIHYLGEYVIIQDENEISAVQGIFGFQYFEQNKTIYDFRQHGQNLSYYTILDDNTITFNKLFLDQNEELQKESLNIVVSDIENVPDLHWDANFVGITTTNNFVPLPDNYLDNYRGRHYLLDYNIEGTDLITQDLNISIEDIEYTVSNVDTVSIDPDILLFYADINMEITVSNNSDEAIENVQLYSSAFEGINCAHNGLKVDEDVISIAPNSSYLVTARYESLEFDNLDYLDGPLCLYAIGANNKFDQNFDDNIFCLSLSEFTTTDDIIRNSDFSVYPSPASNHIQLKTQTTNSTYYIYTDQGKLVSIVKEVDLNQKIDISNFNQGNYLIVEGKTNKKVFFTKI